MGWKPWRCSSRRGLGILRDWNMPRLEGAGVIEHLAAHPALLEGNTVILMLATLRVRSQRLRHFSGVVAATSDKPFDLDEVFAIVQASGH